MWWSFDRRRKYVSLREFNWELFSIWGHKIWKFGHFFEIMASLFCQPCSLKKYIKTCATIQYKAQRRKFSFASDIHRLFIYYAPSNSLRKSSLNFGLKNIMIYVTIFFVMTGKERKKTMNYQIDYVSNRHNGFFNH